MAYTTINKSTDYFNNKLWTGNGNSSHAQTGVGFQPDLVWLKARSESEYHFLFDAIRGATKGISSDLTAAEATYTQGLKSFDSDGFTIGTSNGMNRSGTTYASWNWKANGAGSANTDGTISSTVSANTTSGFSIVSYTGTGANATVGHGLGSAPSMIFVKGRNTGSTNWLTGGSNISSNWGSSLHLNTTGSLDTYAYWGASAPNATTFGLSTDGALNQSGINFIAYCFAEKKGFSKFGSYVGNNNADGVFIYTGFKPAFVMVKRAGGGSQNWGIVDNKRSNYNLISAMLNPNSNGSEGGNNGMDLLSNGFKMRSNDGNSNGYADKHIYMAFAEAPLVGSNNVPCTAR